MTADAWVPGCKINTPEDARRYTQAGADFVVLGRAAILHHDFPPRMLKDPGFEPVGLPVTTDYLRTEGLGELFIKYMTGWKGFVKD